MRKLVDFSKRTLKSVLISSVALAALSGIALAQAPAQPAPPYNVDQGATAPILTNTARVPGTYNSAQQNNPAWTGVMCTLNQTAVTGTSTVFSIQFLDSASGLWQTLVSSAAITTAVNTPTTIMVAPGIQTSSTTPISPLPTNMVVQPLRLPRFWRVQEVITGGTSTTGTIGCNVLK